MSEKITLKRLTCPTCGASLKAENSTDAITCVYCGNTVVPVKEAAAAPKEAAGGLVRVEGIKTPSSALAYIEQFFEQYDWAAFTYAQNLTITEIDELVESLKVTSADSKHTWIAAFQAIAVPFTHKISDCKGILISLIEAYKKDNLDAYSQFDAYKRIMRMINTYKPTLLTKLEKIIGYAEKYGAEEEELVKLRADLANLRNLSVDHAYESLESIPEIKVFNQEKNTRIAKELAAKGIDAEKTYEKAKSLMKLKNYVDALTLLLSLNGYADSKALIEQVDKYFLLGDVLEFGGKLYFFKKDEEESKLLNLYPAEDGKISEKAVIKNIAQVMVSYADVLYYLDSQGRLRKHNMATDLNTAFEVCTEKNIYAYKQKVFLLGTAAPKRSDEEYQNEEETAANKVRDIYMLDLISGSLKIFVRDVLDILDLTDNKLTYTSSLGKNWKKTVNIINVDTSEVVELGGKQLDIKGYVGNSVVYTRNTPNNYNQSLYVRDLSFDADERLIEANIYSFCHIIDDRLFYYVGNTKENVLVNINCDGSQRKQWPQYINEVLFEQGGWLYFIRRAGYNSILCKALLDGNKFSIIAADIDSFVELKNGYLYYINNDKALVKIRMDGSNLQRLCENVRDVLSVREEKIIFLSEDDSVRMGGENLRYRTVHSIYAVDFAGSGKRKLAYDVVMAQEYDETAIYYIAAANNDQEKRKCQAVYKLDVETNNIRQLLALEMKKVEEEEKPMSTFAKAMVVAALALFVALCSFAAEAAGFGMVCLLVAIGVAYFGFTKRNKEEKPDEPAQKRNRFVDFFLADDDDDTNEDTDEDTDEDFNEDFDEEFDEEDEE